MKFEVPPYSQYLDIEDKSWKGKSCGIVSLKMLIDFWHNKTDADPESFEELISEGLEIGAYIPNVGWRHRELVDISKLHGLDGENFDWTDEHTDIAFNKTIPYLSAHPVMASIHRNLKEEESGHLVVLTGYKDGIIYYSDPDSKDRKSVKRSVPLADFLAGWKKRIIVIHEMECECNKDE